MAAAVSSCLKAGTAGAGRLEGGEMCDKYPRWDVAEFLNTEEKACLYLKAAFDDDTGNGDTLRLAWRDIQRAHESGRISMSVFMDCGVLTRTLSKYGVCDAAIRKVADASLCAQ